MSICVCQTPHAPYVESDGRLTCSACRKPDPRNGGSVVQSKEQRDADQRLIRSMNRQRP